MTAPEVSPEEGRVLLFPATRRDGEAVCGFLEREGIDCLVCATALQVAEHLDKGAAALVLTDTGLADVGGRRVVEALQQQPSWSDLPVVLLRRSDAQPEAENLVARMTNVTVLDRPTSSRTLLSAIRTSLRSRARQYQIRDHLAALRNAENALRHADRRKDEFLAMLAHELRNPLAPIRSAVELLPRIVQAGDPRVDSTLQVVKRQVEQMGRLVDDLLDVSRITRGTVELQCEVLELSVVLKQALETVEPLISEKKHSVLLQDPLPVLHVAGDRIRLVQCVANILANAAKYTDPEGQIRIRMNQEGEVVVLAVEDNGIGISAALLPNVFDMFVQSERALDRAQGGLGIGLSVVKQLVEMHQGTVSAHSPGLGMGSGFEVRLPIVGAPSLIEAEAVPVAGQARRIVIVDDNQDAADMLAMELRFQGHDVKTAYDPHAALALVAHYAPDFVFLDIGLPIMNGYEVARRLRASGITAHLVALTGYGQPDDVRRAKEAGFDTHMVKPVDVDHLLQTLARRLETTTA